MAEQADNSKPLKWAYPFQTKDDPATPDRKTVEDSKSYFEALALAGDGFYPVGSNGLWHGGIHFSSETGSKLTQDKGVRAIADGDVVAYRIDSTYPDVNYDCGNATYSTGFVLVRHELTLPKVPVNKTNDAPKKPATDPANNQTVSPATSTSTEEPGLVFYSLYMHLLDWSHYQADRKLPHPKFWGNEYVVTEKSKDREEHLAPGQIGIRVRNANHQPIAILPRGTRITLSDEGPRKGYFAIASFTSGTAVPAINNGYVYKKELGATGSPSSTDAVVALSKPVPVAAGELVGYLGQYARFADAGPLACTDRPLLHLEVFSTDDVKGFIEKSRARDKQLDVQAKTLLVVPKETRLALPLDHDTSIAAGEDVRATADSPKQGEWAKVHKASSAQTSTAPEPAVWVERKMLSPTGSRASTRDSLVAWSRFPLQASNATGPTASFVRVASIQSLTPMATDDQGVRWWQIDVDTPDSKGNLLGWVCETGNLQSPWAWPGFEFIEEQIPPTDLHGKQITDQRLDTPADSADFKAMAERAKAGPLFQKLYDIIDTDKKSGLGTEELRAALRKAWLAQTISRLIVRYESEWGGEMSKWDALDSHMGESINNWQKEKERIKRLQWWKDIPSLGSPEAYHFHPIGLVGNFNSPSPCCELSITNFYEIFGNRKLFTYKDIPKNCNAYNADIGTFVEIINLAFRKYGFDKCSHKQHFLAQCYHESDQFNSTIEYASGWDYDISRYPENFCERTDPNYNERKCKRRKQIISEGNTSVGDGPKYKGKGIIQLTWKGTYQKYENYSGNKVIDNPMIISSNLEVAVDSALWFWTKFKKENINTLIDRCYEELLSSSMSESAIHDEVVRRVTKAVNGGSRGLSSRQELFKKIREKMR